MCRTTSTNSGSHLLECLLVADRAAGSTWHNIVQRVSGKQPDEQVARSMAAELGSPVLGTALDSNTVSIGREQLLGTRSHDILLVHTV